MVLFAQHAVAEQAARNARTVLDGLPVASLHQAPARTLPDFVDLRRLTKARLPLRWAGHVVTLGVVLVAALGVRDPAAFVPQTELVPTFAAPVQKRGVADFQMQRAIVPLLSVADLSAQAPATRMPDMQLLPAFTERHVLVEGETLGQVAAQYNVDIASLFWANDLGSGNVFATGQDLRIPRLVGIPHVIQAGETLDTIATQFNVRSQAIKLFRANAVQETQPLPVGREIFIPGGSLPYPAELLTKLGGEQALKDLRAVAAGTVREADTNLRSGPGREYPKLSTLDAGHQLKLLARHEKWLQVEDAASQIGWVRVDLLGLSQESVAGLPETNDFPPPPPVWMWPTHGEITSPFGWRAAPFRSFHDGLDIANAAWTEIYAARSGRVSEAGWCSGFGYCVKIDHGDGIMTIYGHLIKKPPVQAGEAVDVGAIVGYMGSTFDRSGGGYSTGVHLHFTLKVNGKAVNPFTFLP